MRGSSAPNWIEADRVCKKIHYAKLNRRENAAALKKKAKHIIKHLGRFIAKAKQY